MIGDRYDIITRLRTVLPARWFGDATPVLDIVLSGLGTGWESIYKGLRYTWTQTRIASASGYWLDTVARDFFGHQIMRQSGQSDTVFRSVITRNILRRLGTRQALFQALMDLTERAPIIFEPANTGDTGAYGPQGAAAYGVAGGWGNLSLPYQCFVTAYRPKINGVANVSGWVTNGGGFGIGSLQYANMDQVRGHISDVDIINEVRRVAPIGIVPWIRINN